jgi:hypothetical protein
MVCETEGMARMLREAGTTRVSVLRALAASVAVLMMVPLAGCTGAAPDPMSALERQQIREGVLNEAWQPIAEAYPEAFRPRIAVTTTVPDADWPARIVACLKDRGYQAVALPNDYAYTSTQGQTYLQYTIDGYICTATWIKQSVVEQRMTSQQRDALERYQQAVVRPCLLLSGARSRESPDRFAAGSITGQGNWNPYDVVWQSDLAPRALAYLEQRCPPIPVWMNTARVGAEPRE